MSVNGFKVNGNTVRYDYRYLDNMPDFEGAIAEDYNSAKTYNIGDYVWHNGVFYRCISDIATAETWTAAHWTAAALGNDVGELKSAIGAENKVINIDPVNGYYPIGTAEFFDTRNSFKAGSFIKKISVVNNGVTTPNTLSVSFWKEVGNQMVLYKSTTLSGTTDGTNITFDVNEKLPFNTMLSYADPDIISTGISVKGLLALDAGTTSFDIEYMETLGIKYQLIMSIYYIENIHDEVGLVVHVGEGLDYEEIQDALEDTGENALTIILHPRSYPYSRFSMMRSLDQSYPWSGIAKVRDISIIGMDKAKCVIQDDTGNYNTPPAEIACNGIIRNITFVSTHTKSTLTSGEVPSYAVHVDNRPADANGMRLIFENCVFISHQCCAAGVGVYKNQTVTFKNCEFYTKTPDNFAPYTNYPTSYNNLGAIIMHTSMGNEKGNDYFKLINNIIMTDNNRYAITLRETESSPTCTLEMIGNTLWNSKQGNAEIKWEGQGLAGFIQAPYNRLNNNDDVNAN